MKYSVGGAVSGFRIKLIVSNVKWESLHGVDAEKTYFPGR